MIREQYRQLMEKGALQTPCYFFDEEELLERVRQIREALKICGSRLCFAIKANPFLIPILDSVIEKYEVCSPGELEICREYGIAGEKIIFSGVVKSYEDIKTALEYPVGVITIESRRHWQLLKECAAKTGREAQVMLRLTSGAQFGMEEDALWEIADEIAVSSQITLCGIHFFAGTQRKGQKYEKELPRLENLMHSMQEKYTLDDMTLEYGPGLSVPYFEGESFDEFPESVTSLARYMSEQKYSFPVTIELGRYIAASCGHYVTRIVDIKTAESRHYCLVDGGIHHVNYYGQNMAMRTPVVHHIPQEDTEQRECADREKQEYMVCGSLCTFADILVRGLELSEPRIGDWLVFDNIGAYSVTEGSYLFLSRDLPEIYIYKKQNMKKVRKKMEAWKLNIFRS